MKRVGLTPRWSETESNEVNAVATEPQRNDKKKNAEQQWEVWAEVTITLVGEQDANGPETEHHTATTQEGHEDKDGP